MTEMQHGTPLQNGVSDLNSHTHTEANGYATPTSQSDPKTAHHDDDRTQPDSQSIDHYGPDQPPFKRRKLAESELRKATGPGGRPISPPWRRVSVEGPTSFVEGGRRKSGRTNFVPIELQPQPEGKVRTRGAIQQSAPAVKSKYGGASSYNSSPVKASPSTQTPNTLNRLHLAGRAIKSEGKASPIKRTYDPVSPSKSASDAPPPPKRSYRKKIFSPLPTSGQENVSTVPDPVNTPPKRRPGRPPSSSKLGLGAQMMKGSRKNEEELRGGREEDHEDPEVKRKPQRLNLRIHSPTINIQHPEHVVRREMVDEWHGDKAVRRPKFESFDDWLEREGRFGLETGDADPRITDEEARREANIRTRISQAAKPGGVLSPGKCSTYRPEGNAEPARLYTHQDRLIAHARYFQKLMNQERGKHLRAARECAEKAAAWVKQKEEETYREWRQVQPKTAEEIQQEQDQLFKEIYIQLKEDIKKKWGMVHEMVATRRQQQWQEEQERLGNEALNEVIEKARGALSKRRKRPSEIGSDEDSDAETDVSEGADGPEPMEENESNMSSSQSESEGDQIVGDDDEGLTQEQLREKYAAIPSVVEPSPSHSEHSTPPTLFPDAKGGNRTQNSQGHPDVENKVTMAEDLADHVELEEVDATPLDDSDASAGTTNDEDDDDHDNGEGVSEISVDEGSKKEVQEPKSLILGFFGKQGLQQKRPPPKEAPAPKTNVDEVSDDEEEEVSLIPDATQGPTPSDTTSEEPQSKNHGEAKTNVIECKPVLPQELPALPIPKPVETKTAEQSSAPTEVISATRNSSLPATPVSAKAISTPVPSLLRGTLREYQHFGLDWLAGLYANNENGILADEMGLGKTIQTIALLAHLAEKYEIWGPHLIVVPTSVMLNWEMEFKKFLPGFKILTYYGTKEERLKKRQGMSVDKDKWNVWITSYQLVVNDQQVFKRKAWHYMILDEAHNIKNFQSVRWQTLLTYNTHSRLLLTGTPLQNNLTELWSLLFFLSPEKASIGDGFFSLDDFNKHFKRAESQVLESGREAMNAQSREMITNLHQILRPQLLRRLKADVEKQMPGKYEHVVYCRLSKRQRYLYDAFMSRAQTRETLASSNTFSIMNALMQLRKVCNHPDLFETRDIKTSFAMPKSAVADFEIKELLVRRSLFHDDPWTTVDLNMINLLPGATEQFSALDTIQRQRLGALGAIRQLTSQQWKRVDRNMPFDGTTIRSTLDYFQNNARDIRFEQLRHHSYLTSLRSQRRPLFSPTLEGRLRLDDKIMPRHPTNRARLSEWFQNLSPSLGDMIKSLPERSESLQTTVQKFACVTPKVVATDMADIALTHRGVEVVRDVKATCPEDPYHEARIRLSIAFPDKRLLQYDCGKLQRLDSLLRTLQAGGHRALIFTQMTKVLDILEQFLNIHGHRYLRLDGATKVEQRQALTERFNSDNRILAFILSSRSGGIGINLTGADTVIFYDMDWNPAMDKQCQDRCHRIGQTRDVHIYRMVSEHTIEGNILRKANQKRMLDDVVIQEGDFTTDYFNNRKTEEAVDEEALGDDAANEAMDRVFGGRGAGRVLEQVEDVEDTNAAKQAEREIAQNQDAADFDEKDATNGGASTPKTPATPGDTMPPPPSNLRRSDTDAVERTTTLEAVESGLATMPTDEAVESSGLEVMPSCDDYMLKFVEWELKDVPMQPPEGTKKTKKKLKGKEHTFRKR